MKNEIPKEQLLVIEYCSNTVGAGWFNVTIIDPLLYELLYHDSPDIEIVSNIKFSEILETIDTILEGKDPETESEISIYRLLNEYLKKHPVRN
jgi:hypothetical protein